MIFKSLELIRRKLEAYINFQLELEAQTKAEAIAERMGLPIQPLDPEIEEISFENVALFESIREDENNTANILMSLVNVEEEATLKNNPNFRKIKLNGEVDYQNPPVYINLYVLFTANHTSYQNALKRLSLIMQFFQSKKVFTVPNSFVPQIAGDLVFSDEDNTDVKLNIELFSMTFEQVNHLWGSLGGKQIPFALYVMRLVKIEDVVKQRGGGTILEVEINESIS